MAVSERVAQLQANLGPTVQKEGTLLGSVVVQLVDKKEKEAGEEVEEVELDLR